MPTSGRLVVGSLVPAPAVRCVGRQAWGRLEAQPSAPTMLMSMPSPNSRHLTIFWILQL